MLTTIRKNSKEFKTISATTKGWSVSTLSNFFRPEAIENCVFTDFELSRGKMTKDEKGVIMLHIHGNLWYTLNPASEPTHPIIEVIENSTVEELDNMIAANAAEAPVQYILEDLRDLAYNAHRNTSHVPEKRAQSVVVDYSNELIQDLQSMPEAEHETYKAKYISYLKSYLHSKSNTASSFITGGSGFNVARNQKRMGWADNKYTAFREWRERVLAAMDKRARNNRSENEKLNDEWLKVSKALTRSATTIKNIDLGIQRGYSRALFVSSITKMVDRLASNGQTELVNRSLDLITSLQADLKKPIITAKNSIWSLRQAAEAARETIADKAQQKPTLFLFEGGKIIINYALDRVQIQHDCKPDYETIRSIKKCAFRWSPSQKAWQRQHTPQALAQAKQLVNFK